MINEKELMSINIYKQKYKLYSKRVCVSALILLTACSNTTPYMNNSNNSKTVVNSSGNDIADEKENQDTSVTNDYNLPTLGLQSQKKDKTKTVEYDTGANASDQKIATPHNSSAKGLEDLQSMGFGLANSTASEQVQDWFKAHKMTSELSLGVGERGIKTISFDLLVPLIDSGDDLVFTQVGFRRSNRFTEDYRNTVNVGLGYRHMYEKILLGANTFYDKDITGKNERIGFGLEAWADYVKFAANSYIRLSDWQKSPDMYDYMERPANGWDLRVDAYLPQYPQLGGKFMYEQYYGDNVGLFGSSNKQKDPNAATVGLTYTPIPLVTLSTDYRQGQGGISDTTIKLALNFQLGVDLKKQLSSDEVRSSRLLTNAKYDLVNRNNEIVMDYKKNELGTLTLPANIKNSPNTLVSFPVTFTGSIRNVTWTGSAAGYALPYGGGPTASIKLPPYNVGGINAYTLQAVGSDQYGHVVTSNPTQITVTENQLTMSSSKTTSIANGTDFIVFTAQLKNASGENVPDSDVVWSIQGNAVVLEQTNKTDANGLAHLKLSSKYANLVKVTVKEPNGTEITTDANFTIDASTAKVTSIIGTPTTIIANGVAFTTVVATLQDENGLPIPANTPVTWTTTSGQLSASSSLTDANGQATIVFKTTLAGSVTITANAPKGNASVVITATPDMSSGYIVTLISSTPTLAANGTSTTTITATLQDAFGNALPANSPVNWSTTLGTLSSNTTMTDNTGKATVTLKSTVAGAATVSAMTTQSNASVPTLFMADSATFAPINMNASSTTAVADGTTVVTLGVDVKDANGNKAPANTLVSWSSTIGILSGATSLTDANGHAVITLTSSLAGVSTISATAGVSTATTNVTFTSANTTTLMSVTPSKGLIVAGIADSTIITAVVKDGANNPVQGATVNWSKTIGQLSTASSVTDVNGIATTTFTSTVAGSSTVSATSDDGVAKTTVIQINADATTAQVFSMNSSSSSIPADGESPSNLQAQLTDAYGNPLGAGLVVTWNMTGSNGSLDYTDYIQTTTTITDSSGKATVPLYAYEKGSINITAEYNGVIKNITVNIAEAIVSVSPSVMQSNITQSNVGLSIPINLDIEYNGGSLNASRAGYTIEIECIAGYLCIDNGSPIFPTSITSAPMGTFNFSIGPLTQTGVLKFRARANDGNWVESQEIIIMPEPI